VKTERPASPEAEPKENFAELEKIFGENFTREKTFELTKDYDENHKERELGDYRCFWTEFQNPETGEVVEGKVYLPKETEQYEDVLVLSPGYVGGFAMQEAEYADDFAHSKRAFIVLRHNGLRIEGEDVKKYLHCPEKMGHAKEKGQKFLGKDEKFSWEAANREVLTFLKSLGSKIDEIKNIDIMGHSWGARITLESLVALKKEDSELSRKIEEKINNAILLGSWLETIKENIEPYRDYFDGHAKAEIFKGMNTGEVMDDIFVMFDRLKEYTAKDFPEDVRITAINSLTDNDVDMKVDVPEGKYGEVYRFFKQLKGHEKVGNIVLKALDQEGLSADKIDDRKGAVDVHDYHLRKPTEEEKEQGKELNQIRRWIQKIIEAK